MKKLLLALGIGLAGYMVSRTGVSFAVGATIGWLTAWILDLRPSDSNQTGKETGKEIGRIYGLLVGGIAAQGSGSIVWVTALVIYIVIGGLIGEFIPAFANFVRTLGEDETERA